MNWLQRLERMNAKHRRKSGRRHLNAHRQRLRAAGMKRLDVVLTPEAQRQMAAMRLTGEPVSAFFIRALGALAGNSATCTSAEEIER